MVADFCRAAARVRRTVERKYFMSTYKFISEIGARFLYATPGVGLDWVSLIKLLLSY